MKRVAWLALIATCSLIVVGCGSSAREGVVSSVIAKLETASTKLKNIKDSVDLAIKESDKTKGKVHFDKAIKDAGELKSLGKELQNEKLEADRLRDQPATNEEKQLLSDRYKVNLNQALKKIEDQKKALTQVLASVDSDAAHKDYKSFVQDLRAKILEADGEFEAIARLR